MKVNKFKIVSLILLVITIVVAVYSNISMKLTIQSFKDVDEAFQSYKEAYNCVNSFEEASDYLSDNIKKYVINMNRDYVDNYFREADSLRRRECAIDKLRSFSETNQLEMSLFDEAMTISEELQKTELHAMALLYSIEPYDNANEKVTEYKLTVLEKNMSSYDKQKVAYGLIFGDDYNSKREQIKENIKIGKNLIAENNIDINNRSVDNAEASIELLSAYWGMLVALSIGGLLIVNLYLWFGGMKKKKEE